MAGFSLHAGVAVKSTQREKLERLCRYICRPPRFHGVFAPNSPWRARITPARRGRGARPAKPAREEGRTPAEQQAAMRWAQRIKRVFKVDVETCPNCGGTVKVIASIEDPPVIERVLNHLATKDLPGLWPQTRARPGAARAATG